MALWVVAAAAGAGYLAKNLPNLSGESESSSGNSIPIDSGNSIPRQSESRNWLQQIRDQTCPFRRLSRKRLGGDVSSGREDEVSDGNFEEMDRIGGGLAAGDASTSNSDANFLSNIGNNENCNRLMMTTLPPEFLGEKSSQENPIGTSEKNDVFDNSGDVLSEFETNRLTGKRPLRSRWSNMYSSKPLNSLESCLAAQLCGDQEREEDYVFSSVPSLLTPTVRPLLVTDGNRIFGRDGIDSFCVWDGGPEYRLKSKGGISLEENRDTLLANHLPQQIGSVELPRKPEQRHGKGRLSSSNTRLSGGPFHSQVLSGSPNGIILFFIGITIGIMSAVIANKREADNLNKLLKQNENLVRDLHEELEMKDRLTVKELAGDEYNPSQETIACSSSYPEPVSSSIKQEFEEAAKHDSKEPDDQEVESHELMSKIEAELEAELERLELNTKASTLERISDFVELDPDFEADVVHGDLKTDLVQPGGSQSQSDSDASGTPINHARTANYAVSPRELTLRLHEVIESRLETRIEELKAALQNSQRKVHSLERQHLISQRGLAYHELGSSSTAGSPVFTKEVHDMDRPFVINLSREALDAYNEAYEEIIRVTNSDLDTPDAACCYNRTVEKETTRSDKRLVECQNNNGHNDKIRTWEEWISRSWGSIEVAEESEDDDNADNFLMRRIVEKSRQGSRERNCGQRETRISKQKSQKTLQG